MRPKSVSTQLIAISLTFFVNLPLFAANVYAQCPWKLEPVCIGTKLVRGFKICEPGGREKGEYTAYVEFYENGKIVGQTKAFISPKRIFIDRIFVDANHRREGISSRIFKRLLKHVGPGIEEIGADLAYTNYEAWIERNTALSENPEFANVGMYEMRKIAVKGTPFVKAWSALGFSEVLEIKLELSDDKCLLLGRSCGQLLNY